MRARIVLAAGLAAMPGCQSAHPFRTLATYELPVARCEATIEASGTVPAGHDLGDDGTGTLALGPAPHGGVTNRPGSTFTMALRQGRLEVEGQPVADGDPGMTALLLRTGCAANAAESDELRRAVEGALMGPKATVMEGQTRTLRVVSVSFSPG